MELVELSWGIGSKSEPPHGEESSWTVVGCDRDQNKKHLNYILLNRDR